MTLLDEVIAAHGGREAWESAIEVTARLRSGGFALASKGAGGPFRSYEARVSMREPRTIVVTPYPGGRGVFEGDSVRLETTAGDLVQRRDAMRGRFPGIRRRLRWDALDALYFAGYALWNYFTTPMFLTRAELAEDERRLHATFPDDVPTHSRRQTFHFDGDGLLTRIDYTAEVFGKWARAKHVCTGHRAFDGLVFPASRRVTLRGTRWPTIVWIETDEVSVLRHA